MLADVGVTASPIHSVQEALQHPQARPPLAPPRAPRRAAPPLPFALQVLARGLVTSVQAAVPSSSSSSSAPAAAPLALVGPPVRLSATPQSVRRPPPRLGEHTREVLTAVLGWPAARVQAALDAGHVAQAPPQQLL